MQIACAVCGCVVDRGTRISSCADGDCCCRHLPVESATADLTWATPREALRVIADRRHLRATVRIAAVVGTLLFVINQLDVVLQGEATVVTWIKVAVTYVVPFGVSNLGVLTATRRRA